MIDILFWVFFALSVIFLILSECRVLNYYQAGLHRGYMLGYDDAKKGFLPKNLKDIKRECE